ncbi:HIT family protein [Actinopolymorpha pittospori]
MASSECAFCRVVAGKLPSTVIAEEERAVAFMDDLPATDGALLVVPRTHTRDLLSAEPADLAACVLLAQRMARLLRDRLGASGVNLVQSSGAAAWQTVFHLYLHVVPRYPGDPCRLPWIPSQGDPAKIAAAAAKLTADEPLT